MKNLFISKKLTVAVALCVALFLALAACAPSSVFGAQPAPKAKYKIKYLGSLDASASGKSLTRVNDIYISEAAKEVYVLDTDKEGARVLVFDAATWTPVYWFSALGVGKDSGSASAIAVADDGTVYIAADRDVLVYTYRGRFVRKLDVAPLGKGAVISSLDMGEDSTLYVGYRYIEVDGAGKESTRPAIALYDRQGNIKTYKKVSGSDMARGSISDLRKAGDKYYFLVPETIQVITADAQGNVLGTFGKYSSLLGGFSQPVSLDFVDGVIYVADWNRKMIILFDGAGNPIDEFGGPRVFSMPTKVSVDAEGKIYVADGRNGVRIFERKPETASGQPAEPKKK